MGLHGQYLKIGAATSRRTSTYTAAYGITSPERSYAALSDKSFCRLVLSSFFTPISCPNETTLMRTLFKVKPNANMLENRASGVRNSRKLGLAKGPGY